MAARCETIGKYVMPVFRSYIAKELINAHNLTQVQAAQKLGTTQAAISQYINSKRATKGDEKFGRLLPQIQTIARETAKRLVRNEIRSTDVWLDFCVLCPAFCKKEGFRSAEDYAI
jgi:predicted transcriptional regulator